MKKHIVSFLLALVLVQCTGIGSAGAMNTATAVIDGKTSDRVHLREMASASAASLGLYFTGTEVVYDAGASGEWTCVVIGDQTGWIKSEYLYFGNNPGSVNPQQPLGIVANVNAGSWVNLRSGPHSDSGVIGTLHKDDVVTVLGETATKWYYVKAGNLYGYISADFLAVGASSQGAAGTGVIDGKTSDRVHLRETASSNAKSLGLYFTGTRVRCEPSSNAAWIRVTVGNESGYIKSEFLYRGSNPDSVKPQQPKGVVSNKSGSNWVNLRYNPQLDAGVASKLYNGDTITILGETATHWYYVKAGDLYGYILSGYVSTSDMKPVAGVQSAPQNWKVQFEKDLFDMYGVKPSRYEALTDGAYQVYVILNGEEIPYVVVDSRTGNFHG